MNQGSIAGGNGAYQAHQRGHNRSVGRSERSVQSLGWSDFEFESRRSGEIVATSWKGQSYASAVGYNEAHAAAQLVKTIKRK